MQWCCISSSLKWWDDSLSGSCLIVEQRCPMGCDWPWLKIRDKLFLLNWFYLTKMPVSGAIIHFECLSLNKTFLIEASLQFTENTCVIGHLLMDNSLCFDTAAETRCGGCGGAEEGAGAGADADGQHDSRKRGGICTTQKRVWTAAEEFRYLRGKIPSHATTKGSKVCCMTW